METQVHIPTNKGVKTFCESSIVRVEACSNYSKIFFKDRNPLMVAKVLHWFEANLQHQFFRIHKTHLINQQHVDCLSEDGSAVMLSTGEQLTISRRKRGQIQRVLVSA